MFNCTPVFQENYNSKAKINVNQGGTSSSKTYSIMQLLYYRAIAEPKQVITVTGESIPNLKKGAYRDAQTIYHSTPELKPYVRGWNNTDRIIQFKNGSIIEFISNLDEQSAKNGKRDYLFANEANGISWPIFFQLAIRTRKTIYLDYNPSARFWCHDLLIDCPYDNDLSATVRLIISDHRHNVFLSEDEHRKIEGIKDPERWKVYARGLTGNVEGLIFPNWKQIPDADFPDSDYFWGLDFGYTNDPTALVKCAISANNLFLQECCYETGIPPQKLKEIAIAHGYNSKQIIFCEHDKEQIAQLRRIGITGLPANKGNGSIKGGILKLNEFNVFYTASSKNLHEERTRYMWEKDPITGKSLNEPKGGFDHLLDAARYATYTKFFRQAV